MLQCTAFQMFWPAGSLPPSRLVGLRHLLVEPPERLLVLGVQPIELFHDLINIRLPCGYYVLLYLGSLLVIILNDEVALFAMDLAKCLYADMAPVFSFSGRRSPAMNPVTVLRHSRPANADRPAAVFAAEQCRLWRQ